MSVEQNCRENWEFDEDGTCIADSRAFPEHMDCETSTLCFYGSDGNEIPWDAPCELTPTGETRCSGLSLAHARDKTTMGQPRFCVYFVDGSVDADGSNTPFFATDAMIAVLGATNLEIEPCVGEDYCPPDEPIGGARWLTRVLRNKDSGWTMECHDVKQCETSPCDQLVKRSLQVTGGSNCAIEEVHLATVDCPSCFGFNRMVYCGTAFCETKESGNKEIACIGDGPADRARAFDRLFVSLDIRYGEDSVYVDPDTRELLNAMWATLDDHLDQLDAPGHSSYAKYDRPEIMRILHAETFGKARAVEVTVGGTIDGQTFQILLDSVVTATYVALTGDTAQHVVRGLVTSWNGAEEPITAYEYEGFVLLVHDVNGETFTITVNVPGGGAVFYKTVADVEDEDPPVQGSTDYYPAYDGVDIPVKLVGSSTGAVYSEVATLTLQKVNASIYLIPESHNDSEAARITASGVFNVCVRVKRDAEASGPIAWLNEGDPFDLRVGTGTQHLREKILAIGPSGERVWRQPDDTPEEGVWHFWEALKATQLLSRGPNTFEDTCSAMTCCDFLHTLNGLILYGRTNDNTGLADRFKITRCIISGTLSGETFKISLANYGPPVVIAEHVDTTGNIIDTLEALVTQWNVSANEWAQNITASVDGSAVKLIPDTFTVPKYDVELNAPGGSANFTASVELFTILPQYFEGSIMLTLPDSLASLGCGC